MSSRIIDLHSHSTASDGSDTPALLFGKAKEQGVSALALTDHDTVEGLSAAKEAALEQGIEFIPGVELAAQSAYGEVHILGYWVNVGDATLTAALEVFEQGRHVRNEEVVDKLRGLGLAIDYDAVQAMALASGHKGTIGRPHIARVLHARGYVQSFEEAFTRYLGAGAPAYVSRGLPSLAEVMNVLHAAKATSSVAHIGLTKTSRQGMIAIVAELADLGLHAIEAYHTEHSAEIQHFCVSLADRFALQLTGGSDYHGIIKPRTRLGVGKGNLRTPYYLLEKLKEQRAGLGLPTDME